MELDTGSAAPPGSVVLPGSAPPPGELLEAPLSQELLNYYRARLVESESEIDELRSRVDGIELSQVRQATATAVGIPRRGY